MKLMLYFGKFVFNAQKRNSDFPVYQFAEKMRKCDRWTPLIPDIVNTAKTGPGSKMVDRVRYFGYSLKRIKRHKIFLHIFKKTQ